MDFVNNSRKAIGAVLLDSLRQAGESGLYISQLLEACQKTHPTSIKTTKDILPILHELSINGFTKFYINKWTITIPSIKQEEDNTFFPSACDSAPPVGKLGKAVHPPTVKVPPIISLLDSPKFTSYKNSLQEYCQKVKLPVPLYNSTHISCGLLGNVTFYENKVTAKTPTSNPKDADQRAAHQALIELGYLHEDDAYQPISSLKRSNDGLGSRGFDGPPTKQAKSVSSITYKSMLNQLAQANHILIPDYNCLPSGNGFVCTVTFNEREFVSQRVFPKKKEAEQNAAYTALQILTGLDVEEGEKIIVKQESKDTQSKSPVSEMISEIRSQSGVLNSPSVSTKNSNVGKVSLKNRLQEYCQRLKKDLPFYQTVQNSDLTYTSMVTVENKTFTGQASSTKKGAERAAAESALKSLGLMVQS